MTLLFQYDYLIVGIQKGILIIKCFALRCLVDIFLSGESQ